MVPVELDSSRIPRHIACVMDGNGRWAEQRGLKRTAGHEAAEEALFDAVEGALELGLEWFTVYAFSTENWRRPVDEVRFLINFNRKILRRRVEELHDRNVQIRFLGARDGRVPRGVLSEMAEAEAKTSANDALTLGVAFNYGGRTELVEAARQLVADGVAPGEVTEEALQQRLYAPDMPDPELMIRTSGEHRLSNFMLWQVAYSELVFTDVLWPDFRRGDLYDAVLDFQQRDRRFGGIKP
jgi:undecaprenyl diphosphate synthase